MKKIVLFLMAAMLLSGTSAFAQYGGTIGPLTWNLNTGTLTISGEGAMPDYDNWGEAPWFEHREYIYTIIIETGVTRIGGFTFFACVNLTSITIPNSVTSIGYVAFYACNKLSSITIPNGVTSIEYWAFYHCRGLISITIPNSVITIGASAFEGCESLPSITIGNSVTTIGDWVFKDCISLTSIDVENENDDFSSENGVLFNKDKSALICYPEGKTEDFYAIPNSVTTIGDFAFTQCGLTSITLPNSVINISYQAFRFCKNLTSITMGNSVTTIGDFAFWGCISLTSMTNFNPVPIAIEPDVFLGVSKACTLAVPSESVSAYKEAPVWKDFRITSIMVDPHLVSVSANNDKYGTVTGGGIYDINTTVTVTATAKSGYRFVNWTKDGEEVSIENSYSFTVTEDVELVANFEENVGIVETHCNASLRVYPNPTSGELIIDNGELKIENVEIFDVMGRCVATVETLRATSLQQPTPTINLSFLPAGIYFVRVQTETGMITKKIIKN